jgi:hypothetical protein
MAGVMASMAHRSSFARVLAAGGTPTANASAGGDIGSIVVGSVGVENKIKGGPDDRLALSFLAHRHVLPDCFHPRDHLNLSGHSRNTPEARVRANPSFVRSPFLFVVACSLQPSRIATARVQPAEARSIFTGKQDTMKPVDGSCSRLCSFSMWQ